MRLTKTIVRYIVSSLILLVFASVAVADVVSWTDWTSAATGIVTGTLNTGSSTVDVTSTGLYGFAQISGGTNYWNPSAPYLSAVVDNAPPGTGIVALNPAVWRLSPFLRLFTIPFWHW
jgi:hypothetical protein